jgi:preprotein translocase subunit SecB
MSDESDQGDRPAGQAGERGGQLMLERLYLKDASFESPRAPAVFAEAWKPEFNLDINTRTTSLGDQRFEVVLRATLKATSEGGGTAYIVEVQQAGVFRVFNLEDNDLRRALGTLCPATLFPYVRESVDNLVVKGGFHAVHLAPVNFDALFEEAMRKQTQQAH